MHSFFQRNRTPVPFCTLQAGSSRQLSWWNIDYVAFYPLATEPAYASWEAALAEATIPAVTEFFKKELAAGRENRLKYRSIHFWTGGHKIGVELKKSFARVHQGRFAGDTEFWRDRISNPDTVTVWSKVHKDDRLGCRLSTTEDLAAFKKAIDTELQNVKWSDADSAEPVFA